MQHKQRTLMHPGKPHSLANLQLSYKTDESKFFTSKCLPSLSRGTALPANPHLRCVMKTCERSPHDRICDINEVTVPALTM